MRDIHKGEERDGVMECDLRRRGGCHCRADMKDHFTVSGFGGDWRTV